MSHAFSFDGGKELSRIGATWFITYAYAEKIDPTERRWLNSATHASRASNYKQAAQWHQYWYTEVTKMSESRLNKNEIGVSGVEAKKMAHKLVEWRG